MYRRERTLERIEKSCMGKIIYQTHQDKMNDYWNLEEKC